MVQGIVPFLSLISENRPVLFIHSRIQMDSIYNIHISGRFLWDCTCRGLGPWTPCRCGRRAAECSAKATKPSDPGWRCRRGRSHVSADVNEEQSLEFFVKAKCFKSPACEISSWILLWMKGYFVVAFRPKLPKKLLIFHFAYPCPEYFITLRNILKEILWHLHLIYIYVKI